MKRYAAIGLVLLLGGCVTTQEQEMVWKRTDGRSTTGDAELAQQFVVDKTICLGETQKSAVGMAPIYYHGLGGAIGAAIIQNERGDSLRDVAKGCMAQHGYLQVARSQGPTNGQIYNTPPDVAY